MIVDSILSNAKALLKGDIVDCDLAIDQGVIQKIGKETQMPKADERIDMHHLLLMPGIIDAHVHLRDEEKAYKETFLSGTAAAAAGGVTTVLDMPNNTPVTMSVETLRNRMQIASRQTLVNVGFYSEFPENMKEVKAIAAEGAIGFKLFMGEQVGGLNVDNDQALAEAFAEAGDLGIPVATHAEDHSLLKSRTEKLQFNNRNDIKAFLKAHDESAEFAAVERLLNIAAETKKAHLHICHISTEKALKVVAEAKKSGLDLTCEATPHHLLLTQEAYDHLRSHALTLPPLRSKSNQDALWKGISEMDIDTVGSDHAPHSMDEKDAGSIWDVKAGVPGLETTLPLILTSVHKGRLTFGRAIELLCEKPAEIFGLQNRGRLEQGKAADVVALDFNLKFKIDASKFKSKAKLSPFDNWQVQGKPVKTFINGHLVMDDGNIVAKPGYGGVIRRQQP